MQPKLSSLHQRFGTHPCGEGGEYETFTTDSPLFKSRIDIQATEVAVVDQSDVAPVAYLRIKHASLVKKEVAPQVILNITAPPLLEHPFEVLRTHVDRSLDCVALCSVLEPHYLHPRLVSEPGLSIRHIGPWIAVGNVRLPTSHPRPLSVGEEVARCFETLQSASRPVYPHTVTHTFHQICWLKIRPCRGFFQLQQ